MDRSGVFFFFAVMVLMPHVLTAQTVIHISQIEKNEENNPVQHLEAVSEILLSGNYKVVFSDESYELVHFDMGVLNGPYQVYMKGQVVREGMFRDGEKHGEWLYYQKPWGNSAFGYLTEKQSFDKGRRHGEWIKYRTDAASLKKTAPVPEIVIVYEQDGMLSQKEYYDEGGLKSSTTYQKSIKHGLYQEFYLSGKPLLEITYQDGLKTGETTVWHDNGNVYKKGQYDEEGKATGKWESWSEDQLYTGFVHYVSGQKIGEFELYYDNGQLQDKGSYDPEGNLAYVGHYRRFYRNRNPAEETYYDKEGVKQGKSITWYENGRKKREVHYKDGVMTGKEVHYFENGQVNDITHYSKIERVVDEWGEHQDLAKEGAYKRYNEEGKLVEEGSYAHNKREGVWRFYSDEKLRRLETYHQGLYKGAYELYHKGNIREKGSYKIVTDQYGHQYQKKDGLWVEYYYEEYYTPGTKRWEINWKEGVKHGTARRYDEKGQLREEEIYEGGRLVERIEHQ